MRVEVIEKHGKKKRYYFVLARKGEFTRLYGRYTKRAKAVARAESVMKKLRYD